MDDDRRAADVYEFVDTSAEIVTTFHLGGMSRINQFPRKQLNENRK